LNIEEAQEKLISERSALELLAQYRHQLHPSSSVQVVRVKNVVSRLKKHISNLLPGSSTDFKVFVIESPEANAFVLPGGQIFVFSGLLGIASDDNCLATVLAHEVITKIRANTHQYLDCAQTSSPWR